MAKKIVKELKRIESDDKVIYAFLATLLSIVGFVIAILVKKNDKYVMYYAKHSLVIFIIGAVGGAIASILTWIPIIGPIIYAAIFIIIFLTWMLSWVYALTGKIKTIPIITDLAKKFEF